MKRLILMILFATLPVTAQIRTEFDRKMAEPFEPFEIIDNIYYVGTADAAVYLITSEQGHILLDGALRKRRRRLKTISRNSVSRWKTSRSF
ncbi:MAG: hypothetical protein OEM82_05700 [Acidobacteriota bacterium]|nr:hypothetical protein [Acidobacteriota bacterium]